MRSSILAIGVIALFGAVQPANAQMCGGGQQQAQSSPGMGGMMMCGGGMGASTQDDPMADKPAEKPKQSGMCPCCRNMAMMRGGMGQGGMQHDMPGMGQPKQQ